MTPPAHDPARGPDAPTPDLPTVSDTPATLPPSATTLLTCVPCGKAFPAGSIDASRAACPACGAPLRRVELALPRPAPAAAPSPEGRPFGRYLLRRELGRGGMGVVFEAWDPQLGRAVALKMLHASAADGDIASVERFVREARSAARLRHASIASIHDVGEADGRHYLTMDLIEGKNLAERIREAEWAEAPMRRRVEALAQVAEALAYAHAEGIVHRDVKPSNVLVDVRGRAVLMDFGLAKELTGSELEGLTVSGAVLGTPQYMSPEQAEGATARVGPASDVFSFGVLMYRVLTGELPFAGDGISSLLGILSHDPTPPRRANPRVEADLETICLRCLEKDPVRRFANGADLAAGSGFDDALQRQVAEALIAISSEDRPRARQICLEGLSRFPHAEGREEFHWVLGIATPAEEAIRELDRAIAIRPKYPMALFSRAQVKLATDLDAARRDLKEALALSPRFVEARFCLACLLQIQKDAAGAIAEYDGVIDVEPGHVDALYNRAVVKCETGDMRGALADLDAAIGIEPACPDAHRVRGEVKCYLGDYDGAIADETVAIERNPRDPWAIFRRGASRQQKGDLAGAIEDYGAAIGIDARMANAWLYRAECRLGIGEADRALEDVGEALRLGADPADAYAARGAIYLTKGDRDRGLEDLRKALRLAPPEWPRRAWVEETLGSNR